MRKLLGCSPAVAGTILQSLKAVATAEGRLPLDGLQRTTLVALRDHVLRSDADLDALDPSLPADLERTIGDPELRANLVHLAIAIPFVDPKHERERAAIPPMVRGPSDRWCGSLGPPAKRIAPTA